MQKIKAGDPIKIYRSSKGGYYHFGIYAGDEKVIHYTESKGGKGEVQRTSKKGFVRNSTSPIKLVEFPKARNGRTTSIPVETFYSQNDLINIGSWPDWFMSQFNEYKLYSRKETLKRAESKLGEDKYDILFNNCEHFVWWCKTGIKRSEQVRDKLDELYNPPKRLPRFPRPQSPIPELLLEDDVGEDILKRLVKILLPKKNPWNPF